MRILRKHKLVFDKWVFYLIFLGNVYLVNNGYSQSYYFKNYTIEDGLAQDQILCIFQDSKGYIWLGTNGGGVSKFDGKNFQNLNETNGLVNNIVRNISEDRFGNIWLGTQNGISRYDGFNFENVTSKHGIFKGEITTQCIDDDNCIWIGSQYSKVIYKSSLSEDGSGIIKFEIIDIGLTQNTTINKIIKDNKKLLYYIKIVMNFKL